MTVDSYCVAGLLRDLLAAPSVDRSATVASPRSAVAAAVDSYLGQCMGLTAPELKPVNIMLMVEVRDYGAQIPAEIMEAQTGFQANISFVEIPELTPTVAADLMSPTGPSLHGFTIDPSTVVDLVALDALAPLEGALLNDTEMQWTDVLPYMRTVATVYDGHVIGIPLTGHASVMYYRKDILAASGLAVPNTWEELLTVASRLNGTDLNGDGVPDYGICWQVENCLEAPVIISQIVAPYIQSKGTTQGWMYDPEDMTLLLNSTAMERALELLRKLHAVAAPMPNCELFHVPFLQGSCAFSIKWGEQFKAVEFQPNAARGNLGVAQLPGSTRVLDRPTGRLLPCTNATCPFASLERDPTSGQAILVNRAPHFGFGSFAGATRKSADPGYQRAVYKYFAYVGGAKTSFEVLLMFGSLIGPFRYSHLNPDNLQRWVDAGYDASDTLSFLAAWNASMADPNNALDIRILNAHRYRAILNDAASNASLTNMPISDILAALTNQFERVTNESGGRDAVRGGYRTGLGIRALPSQSPPASKPAAQGSSSHVEAYASVPAAVVALVLLAAAYMFWARTQGRTLIGGSRPPGPGPETTLLVATLPDLPYLLQDLPAPLVERALSQYLALMRRLLREHHGYEVLPDSTGVALRAGTTGGGLVDASDPSGFAAELTTSPSNAAPDAEDSVPLTPAAALRLCVNGSAGALPAGGGSGCTAAGALSASADVAAPEQRWAFVAAFRSPRRALEFAAAVTSELMTLDWPPQLLHHPACAPLFAMPTATLPPEPQEEPSPPLNDTHSDALATLVPPPLHQLRPRAEASWSTVTADSDSAVTSHAKGTAGGGLCGAKRSPFGEIVAAEDVTADVREAAPLQQRQPPTTEPSMIARMLLGRSRVFSLAHKDTPRGPRGTEPEASPHASPSGASGIEGSPATDLAPSAARRLTRPVGAPPPAAAPALTSAASPFVSAAFTASHEMDVAPPPQPARAQPDGPPVANADLLAWMSELADPLRSIPGACSTGTPAGGQSTRDMRRATSRQLSTQLSMLDLSPYSATTAVRMSQFYEAAFRVFNVYGQLVSYTQGFSGTCREGPKAAGPLDPRLGLQGQGSRKRSMGDGLTTKAARPSAGPPATPPAGGGGGPSDRLAEEGLCERSGGFVRSPSGALIGPLPVPRGTTNDAAPSSHVPEPAGTVASGPGDGAGRCRILQPVPGYPLLTLAPPPPPQAPSLLAMVPSNERQADALQGDIAGNASQPRPPTQPLLQFTRRQPDQQSECSLAPERSSAAWSLRGSRPSRATRPTPAAGASRAHKGEWLGDEGPGRRPDPKLAAVMAEQGMLVHRGLRVCMGLSSGVAPAHMRYCRTARRMRYGGPSLAIARCLSYAAYGTASRLLLAGGCVKQLGAVAVHGSAHSAPSSSVVKLNIGEYRLQQPSPTPHTLDVYMALPPRLGPSLAVHLPPRGSLQTQAGVLEAPVGDVTIVFANLVGAKALLAWDSVEAKAAIAQMELLACRRLSALGGYLVEAADGLLLAAFVQPAAAVRWGLSVVSHLMAADWSPKLLEHELCEEVVVLADDSGDGGGDYAQWLLERKAARREGSQSKPQSPPPPQQQQAQLLRQLGTQNVQQGKQPQVLQRRQVFERRAHSFSLLRSLPWRTLAQLKPLPGEPNTTGDVGETPVFRSASACSYRIERDKGSSSGDLTRSNDDDEADCGAAEADAHGATSSTPPAGNRLLYRGLRLKVGIDVGRAEAMVSEVTGRATYKGRVMNRTARIAAKAPAGQVWCSEAVWRAANQAATTQTQEPGHAPSTAAENGGKSKGRGNGDSDPEAEAVEASLPLSGCYQGRHALKGIPEPMPLWCCRFGYTSYGNGASGGATGGPRSPSALASPRSPGQRWTGARPRPAAASQPGGDQRGAPHVASTKQAPQHFTEARRAAPLTTGIAVAEPPEARSARTAATAFPSAAGANTAAAAPTLPQLNPLTTIGRAPSRLCRSTSNFAQIVAGADGISICDSGSARGVGGSVSALDIPGGLAENAPVGAQAAGKLSAVDSSGPAAAAGNGGGAGIGGSLCPMPPVQEVPASREGQAPDGAQRSTRNSPAGQPNLVSEVGDSALKVEEVVALPLAPFAPCGGLVGER